MTIALQSLEEIRRVNSGFPYTEPIRHWKEQGKKVIGWSCNYVPEEIIYAAGMLPFRVVGDAEELNLDEANYYIHTNMCSFTRSCFQLAVSKKLDFLDGFVPCATCNCAMRLGDVWHHYIRTPVIHVLNVPRINNKTALNFFTSELSEFKQKLEQSFQVEISDEALKKAIDTYNESRELLQELYELRKSKTPPLSGSETLEIVNASSRMPRSQYNELLGRLIEEIKRTKRSLRGSARIMISGSVLNNPYFIKTIEDMGALVVVDELCTGYRYWTGLARPDASTSLVAALSQRYLDIPPCARTNPVDNRASHMLKLAKDYRVDGVIAAVIRNCDNQIHQQPVMRWKLEEQGIPVLEMNIEYGSPGTGQIRTRVEAFLEMLAERRG